MFIRCFIRVSWLASILAGLGGSAAEFIAGADMSHLRFFEERGVVYREDGREQDALNLLKARGLNCVRLRLFTSSAAQAQQNPYNYINNLEYTLPLAVRVKKAGLKFLLDFHFSDTWADPGKQAKPSSWTNLNFAELEAQVRAYNSNCIAAFRSAGALPDYVQPGNEIIGGLLWTDGKVGGAYDSPAQWSNLGRLLKAAIRGIEDAAGEQRPQVMIHIDRGGDWGGTQWFFDRLNQQQVPYDMIGQSYYPWWHGSLEALRICLTNTAARYGKRIVIAETAFPWTNSADVYGIPATTNGQVKYVTALAEIANSVSGDKVAGIIWWGTEYQQLAGYGLAGFDRRSFFGTGGDILPVAAAFGQLAASRKLKASLDGPNLLLEWPLSGAGMRLVQAMSLNSLAAWLPVTNPVQPAGTGFMTTLSGPYSPTAFYRLESTWASPP